MRFVVLTPADQLRGKSPKVLEKYLDGLTPEQIMAKFGGDNETNARIRKTRVEKVEEDDEWETESLAEKLQRIETPSLPPIPSERRHLAELMGASSINAHAIRWDRLAETLTRNEQIKLAKKCRKEADPVQAWNDHIKSMEPSTVGASKAGVVSIYLLPGTEATAQLGGLPPPRGGMANPEEVQAFKTAAENHELPDRVLRCEYSGESLVEKDKGIRKTWRIAPNWQGMNLNMARHAVSAAAILAGIVEGHIRGEVPAVVHRLAADGDAWCVLAVSTKHPVFFQLARFLLMLRDVCYFQVDEQDMRENLRAMARVAAQAVKEEGYE
jgi:hypothetical protein